ncbi:MAG: UDP-glucose/GDP-mannose dehydrogenase family protein [Actinomycetia bacterium]|nr:UDP-glucose/GDP-mannose dehydrogenase family protein [Actinomycetes bacterium]
MRVGVYGLGYVGSVTASLLAEAGHAVWGIDIDPGKVAKVGAGQAPVVEPGLDDILTKVVGEGRLQAVVAGRDEIPDLEVHVVCVGTPSLTNGSLDTGHVVAVAGDIGVRLAHGPRRQVIVFRSTMLPGTADVQLVGLLETSSGLVAGQDFGVAVCPEFMRETTAVADFNDPPFTVIGADDDWVSDVVAELFAFLHAPIRRVDLATAETIKYACNAFHAVKVAFANEIGRFARSTGADSRRVMEVFCSDDQLNISSAYLRPGFAFGGSCLPKDLRAVVHRARSLDLDLPLLSSVLPSNEQHLRHAIGLVLEHAPRSVGLLGLSFKTGTDDLRESPYVMLTEALLGKGIGVRIWDPDLQTDRLIGGNLSFIEQRLPHLARLLRPLPEAVVAGSDVVVLGSDDPRARTALLSGSDAAIIDLVGHRDLALAPNVVGVAW